MGDSGWFLLGAPWDCSGTGRGESAAPAALRSSGVCDLVSRDIGDAATLIDSKSRDELTGVRALPETIRAAEHLSDTLRGAMRDLPGLRPLVLGGDCSILLGIFPALRRSVGPARLWFVDGHPDYSDGPGSETGETADMDLAVLTGVGAGPLVMLAGEAPMLSLGDVVLLGHRTQRLDEGSSAELQRLPAGLRRIDADELRTDPSGAGHRAAQWLSGRDLSQRSTAEAASGPGTWLHIDLDVLDPASLPAVTYPQPGGPDWKQLTSVLQPLARSPGLLGVSVADFRPDLDPTGRLASQIVDLLAATLDLST